MDILQQLPKPFFVLAPMDDVTDTVFRRIVGACAPPDLYFTEFVNADGLQSPGKPKLMKKLRFTSAERPIVAQIWGKNPENFRKTAEELVTMGFAGIDLNMGCPIKAEVNNGTCSALINNRELAVELIRATQEGAAGRVPISVKTRLGFNEIDLSWCELLLHQKLDMLTIHGRTRKEMSKVPAHWDSIGHVRVLRDTLKLNTLIVGNGDIDSRQHGLELAQQYELDGIMIGRGVFQNPFCFAEDGLLKWENYTTGERIDLFKRHIELFAGTWQDGEHAIHTLNKFCKVYISNFEGAKELREQLMRATSTDALLSLLAQAQLT